MRLRKSWAPPCRRLPWLARRPGSRSACPRARRRNPLEVPGGRLSFPGFSASDATLTTTTCPTLGNCVAVGYTSAATQASIVATQVNGVWGSAQVINGTGSLGNGSGGILTNVACGGPGDCTATGWYWGRASHAALLPTSCSSATTLPPTAANRCAMVAWPRSM
jgi:hypothetical protein